MKEKPTKKQIIDHIIGRPRTNCTKKEEHIIDIARKEWQYEDVIIDENAKVEEVEDGAWVTAKVWVYKQEYEGWDKKAA